MKTNASLMTLAIALLGGQFASAQTTTSSPELAAPSQDAPPAPATQPADAEAEAAVDENHPVALDRTGIDWALPFSSAKSRAIETNRLLMIKPVAFGTKPDGGW